MLPQTIQNEAYALNNIGITQNGFVAGFVNVALKRQKRGNEFVQLKPGSKTVPSMYREWIPSFGAVGRYIGKHFFGTFGIGVQK